jgi:hypothetical protein
MPIEGLHPAHRNILPSHDLGGFSGKRTLSDSGDEA